MSNPSHSSSPFSSFSLSDRLVMLERFGLQPQTLRNADNRGSASARGHNTGTASHGPAPIFGTQGPLCAPTPPPPAARPLLRGSGAPTAIKKYNTKLIRQEMQKEPVIDLSSSSSAPPSSLSSFSRLRFRHHISSSPPSAPPSLADQLAHIKRTMEHKTQEMVKHYKDKVDSLVYGQSRASLPSSSPSFDTPLIPPSVAFNRSQLSETIQQYSQKYQQLHDKLADLDKIKAELFRVADENLALRHRYERLRVKAHINAEEMDHDENMKRERQLIEGENKEKKEAKKKKKTRPPPHPTIISSRSRGAPSPVYQSDGYFNTANDEQENGTNNAGARTAADTAEAAQTTAVPMNASNIPPSPAASSAPPVVPPSPSATQPILATSNNPTTSSSNPSPAPPAPSSSSAPAGPSVNAHLDDQIYYLSKYILEKQKQIRVLEEQFTQAQSGYHKMQGRLYHEMSEYEKAREEAAKRIEKIKEHIQYEKYKQEVEWEEDEANKAAAAEDGQGEGDGHGKKSVNGEFIATIRSMESSLSRLLDSAAPPSSALIDELKGAIVAHIQYNDRLLEQRQRMRAVHPAMEAALDQAAAVAHQRHDEYLSRLTANQRSLENYASELNKRFQLFHQHSDMILSSIGLCANIDQSLKLDLMCRHCLLLLERPVLLWPCGHTVCYKDLRWPTKEQMANAEKDKEKNVPTPWQSTNTTASASPTQSNAAASASIGSSASSSPSSSFSSAPIACICPECANQFEAANLNAQHNTINSNNNDDGNNDNNRDSSNNSPTKNGGQRVYPNVAQLNNEFDEANQYPNPFFNPQIPAYPAPNNTNTAYSSPRFNTISPSAAAASPSSSALAASPSSSASVPMIPFKGLFYAIPNRVAIQLLQFYSNSVQLFQSIVPRIDAYQQVNRPRYVELYEQANRQIEGMKQEWKRIHDNYMEKVKPWNNNSNKSSSNTISTPSNPQSADSSPRVPPSSLHHRTGSRVSKARGKDSPVSVASPPLSSRSLSPRSQLRSSTAPAHGGRSAMKAFDPRLVQQIEEFAQQIKDEQF